MGRRNARPEKRRRKANHSVILAYLAAITALVAAITGLLTANRGTPKGTQGLPSMCSSDVRMLPAQRAAVMGEPFRLGAAPGGGH